MTLSRGPACHWCVCDCKALLSSRYLPNLQAVSIQQLGNPRSSPQTPRPQTPMLLYSELFCSQCRVGQRLCLIWELSDPSLLGRPKPESGQTQSHNKPRNVTRARVAAMGDIMRLQGKKNAHKHLQVQAGEQADQLTRASCRGIQAVSCFHGSTKVCCELLAWMHKIFPALPGIISQRTRRW